MLINCKRKYKKKKSIELFLKFLSSVNFINFINQFRHDFLQKISQFVKVRNMQFFDFLDFLEDRCIKITFLFLKYCFYMLTIFNITFFLHKFQKHKNFSIAQFFCKTDRHKYVTEAYSYFYILEINK